MNPVESFSPPDPSLNASQWARAEKQKLMELELSKPFNRVPPAMIIGDLIGQKNLLTALGLAGIAVPTLLSWICSYFGIDLVFSLLGGSDALASAIAYTAIGISFLCALGGVLGGVANVYLALRYSAPQALKAIVGKEKPITKFRLTFQTVALLFLGGFFAVASLSSCFAACGSHLDMGKLNDASSLFDKWPIITAALIVLLTGLCFLDSVNKQKDMRRELKLDQLESCLDSMDWERAKTLYENENKPVSVSNDEKAELCSLASLFRGDRFNVNSLDKEAIIRELIKKGLTEEEIIKELHNKHQSNILQRLQSEIGPSAAIPAHALLEGIATKNAKGAKEALEELKAKLGTWKFRQRMRLFQTTLYMLPLLISLPLLLNALGLIPGCSFLAIIPPDAVVVIAVASNLLLWVGTTMAIRMDYWPLERNDTLIIPFVETFFEKKHREGSIK